MTDKIEQLKALLKDVPDEPFVLFALAQEYAKKGDLTVAVQYYERLAATAPDYTGTYYHLGKLYEQLGETARAISVYQKGMEITRNKNDHHALSELQSALEMITDG